MFQCVLDKLNQLINDFEAISTADVIQRIGEIKQKFQDRYSVLVHHNDRCAREEIHKRISTYITGSDKDEDIIEKILSIQKETREEFAKRFEQSVNTWPDLLQAKEEQVLLLLTKRLAKKPIPLGGSLDKTDPQPLLWKVAHIDACLNTAQLITAETIDAQMFHASGYNHIEDGAEEFGCAELSCGWATSDVRRYLNGAFFQHTFSDPEKAILLKTKRHMNSNNYLLPRDMSEDYVYLLSVDEFLRLDPHLQTCTPHSEHTAYWLAEQNDHGWDDGQLPTLYAAQCATGELVSYTGNAKLLIRPVITIALDELIALEKTVKP